MLSVIQSQLALVLGALAVLVLLSVRRLTKEPTLKKDLYGAIIFFGVFLVLRLNGLWIENALPQPAQPYVRVTWMLAFAYGSVRVVVASGLWLRRRLTGRPPVKLLRDVVDGILYVVCTIQIVYSQLQFDVTTVVGTSAVLSLVLGFALQDTLSNLFSGISLQMEAPFKEGDFIRVQLHEGRVTQISWRSCSIQTNRGEVVTLPNALIAKEAIKNFTRGNESVGVEIFIGATYTVPPNHFKAEAMTGLMAIDHVLKSPPPLVRLHEFSDTAVRYMIRFYLQDYGQLVSVQDEVLTHLWYRFGRTGIDMPFLQRSVGARSVSAMPSPQALDIVTSLEIFGAFAENEREELAASAKERHFGRGESVVNEGEPGETFYAIVSGTLSVQTGRPSREVAQLGQGQAFGEMSLLTAEPRAATVRAIEDCVLLEFDRDSFRKHFAEHPERIASLAALLAERKVRLDEVSALADNAPKRETNRIMERLRQIFKI
jgi:small-conductance mechanosensitive channel